MLRRMARFVREQIERNNTLLLYTLAQALHIRDTLLLNILRGSDTVQKLRCFLFASKSRDRWRLVGHVVVNVTYAMHCIGPQRQATERLRCDCFLFPQ